MQKEDYECPWCGTRFQDSYRLDAHAKNHYSEIAAASTAVIVAQ